MLCLEAFVSSIRRYLCGSSDPHTDTLERVNWYTILLLCQCLRFNLSMSADAR